MVAALRRVLAWALLLAASVTPAVADVRLCGAALPSSLFEQQQALQLSAALRDVLARHPGVVGAVIARDGTDLRRWSIRHTHAGVMLKDHPAGAWSVRQLYYDCEDGAPRVFDQGLAGFLLGSRDPQRGFVSLTLLAGTAGRSLVEAVLDDRLALSLLHERYSANAHAFSTRYQNCNQWAVEMMALAWGGARSRVQAQDWLQAAGYRAQTVSVGAPGWLWLSRLSPWLHLDDHPPQDLAAARLRISLPEGITRWLAERHPHWVQLQACWRDGRLVVREGTAALSEGCTPQSGDEVLWPAQAATYTRVHERFP